MKDIHWNVLNCPVCRAAVLRTDDGCRCEGCGKNFPYSLAGKLRMIPAAVKEDEEDIRSVSGLSARWKELVLDIIRPPVLAMKYRQKEHLEHFLSMSGADSFILNIGSGRMRLRQDIINLDIEDHPEVDIIADAHNIPFKDSSMDMILSVSMLEHVERPSEVIDEMFRVIKDGGYVYIETPFMVPFHPHDITGKDFTRFTCNGLKNLLNRFEILECGIASGPASAFSQSLGQFISIVLSAFTRSGRVKFFSEIISGWLVFPIKYLDIFFSKAHFACFMANAFYCIGRKSPERGR